MSKTSKNDNKKSVEHFNMFTDDMPRTILIVLLVLALLVLLFIVGKEFMNKKSQSGGLDLSSASNFINLTNTPYFN